MASLAFFRQKDDFGSRLAFFEKEADWSLAGISQSFELREARFSLAVLKFRNRGGSDAGFFLDGTDGQLQGQSCLFQTVVEIHVTLYLPNCHSVSQNFLCYYSTKIQQRCSQIQNFTNFMFPERRSMRHNPLFR